MIKSLSAHNVKHTLVCVCECVYFQGVCEQTGYDKRLGKVKRNGWLPHPAGTASQPPRIDLNTESDGGEQGEVSGMKDGTNTAEKWRGTAGDISGAWEEAAAVQDGLT